MHVEVTVRITASDISPIKDAKRWLSLIGSWNDEHQKITRSTFRPGVFTKVKVIDILAQNQSWLRIIEGRRSKFQAYLDSDQPDTQIVLGSLRLIATIIVEAMEVAAIEVNRHNDFWENVIVHFPRSDA